MSIASDIGKEIVGLGILAGALYIGYKWIEKKTSFNLNDLLGTNTSDTSTTTNAFDVLNLNPVVNPSGIANEATKTIIQNPEVAKNAIWDYNPITNLSGTVSNITSDITNILSSMFGTKTQTNTNSVVNAGINSANVVMQQLGYNEATGDIYPYYGSSGNLLGFQSGNPALNLNTGWAGWPTYDPFAGKTFVQGQGWI